MVDTKGFNGVADGTVIGGNSSTTLYGKIFSQAIFIQRANLIDTDISNVSDQGITDAVNSVYEHMDNQGIVDLKALSLEQIQGIALNAADNRDVMHDIIVNALLRVRSGVDVPAAARTGRTLAVG